MFMSCQREMETFMKFILGILAAAFMFTAAPARAQEAEKVANAEVAALAWLALTDAGDYSRSGFQARRTASTW
jgi:hypothetical protein